MSKEAIKLALDDLISEYHMETSSFAKRVADIFEEALAEQPAQQEPVGTVNELFDEAVIELCKFNREMLVYTTPPAQLKPWGFHMQFNNNKDATFKGLEKLAECEAHQEAGETITLLYIKEQPAQQDIPDLIAGALGVSRGTAYDMMREALAEQLAQQEPVARIAELEETVRHLNHALREATEAPTFMGEPVSAEPAARIKGVDEYGPMLDWYTHWVNFPVGTNLYTSPQPAQRTWVGLSHDEYDAICDKHSAMSDFDFLADIEAKLREKNQ